MKKILLVAFLFLFSFVHAQEYKSFPMWDHRLPFEKRVNDLVSRLTLEEKVAQMMNHAPAIEKLGIPAYDWWNEVLHGVARTPYRVTVFPQAIGMAATWDTSSMFTMADFAALEGRAVYNKAVAQRRAGERYLGLTYWTPNINIFRDPRWGRGQETYGEDPFLTATMAASFVRGLQGSDPKYLKAAACAKHYAVHSGPEPSRHVDNFNPSPYDLWDTYLPAFKELVVNARVAGVMCAYNAVNTQPCCANDLLMNDILRNKWKFKGYVTSDCWAIDDFYKNHKTHADASAASADAVMHGTDVDCGTASFLALVDAVKKGLVKEQQIDVSVKRLFTIRYRLGLFDPVSIVKYAQTPQSVLESAPHKEHALKMARESIVLLKNANNTLPLSKNIRKIAVVGPNADNPIAVLGNYNGTPTEIVTVLAGIKQKLGADVEVIYEKALNFTNDTLLVYADVNNQYSIEGKQGFKAEYYNNIDLKEEPVIVTEPVLDKFWQEGETVTGEIRANNFSARYTSFYKAENDGEISFEIEADDGYKVFIDDKEVLNAWVRNRWGARTYRQPIEKGKQYKIVVEYWQGEGKGNVRLRAGNFERFELNNLLERIKDADAIIYVGGISPQLEGEEMKVDYPGFNGGDRTSIMLPQIQTDVMKKLQVTGRPVVFVMMTGSAIAIPWEDVNIPAIVNAWYGGQGAGTAVADVLFGDYNPAGRLPVTFYKNDSDLPAFNDYSMSDRTYRYFKGEPLYPFGYGLSFTTFKYDMLRLPASSSSGKTVKVSARVTNTGKITGEEVVQLYITHEGRQGKSPLKSLKGFQRILLKPGQSKVVTFNITPAQLSLIAEDGTSYRLKEKVMISIGGGQPGIKNKTTSNVITSNISIL